MKEIFHAANSRGYADHGWLKSYHSFSFADYHDPAKIRFGALRVVNDDWIGGGFGTHPHDNMEIVTIVLEGALQHKDTLGNEYQITAGDVQRMSAGTGIAHSEFNASKDQAVNLFQIWVFPKERNITPSYEQKRFDVSKSNNRFQFLVSPDGKDGSLKINQDSWFSQATIDTAIEYPLHAPNSGVYLICASGKVKIGSRTLSPRDAIGISEVESISIQALEKSHLVGIEIPMI